MTDKEEAFRWFLLGFAQSGEGYNAECAFPHCAPRNARKKYGYYGTYKVPPDELSGFFDSLWASRADLDDLEEIMGEDS